MDSDYRDDLDLAARVARGDPEAFNEFYSRHTGLVFAFVYHLLNGARADAEEIWQDTFVAALRALPGYRGQGRLSSWLCGIARRKAADFHRHKGGTRAPLLSVSPEQLLDLMDRCPLPDEIPQQSATRARVLEALSELPLDYRNALMMRYVDGQPLEEPGFRQALDKLSRSRYVCGVWLIHPDGRIAFSTAGFATRGSVQEWARAETRRVLSEMPEGFLSPPQRVALLAASAIQSEGEHNDIFRQMIRPLRNGDDTVLGFVGVSYQATPDADVFPGVGYAITLFLIPIGLLVYWLALPCWVFLDANARGERAWIWAMFVLLGNLVALFAYLLTRHPQPHTGPEASSEKTI